MVEDKSGQRIPEVVFRTRHEGTWRDLSTREIFAGKRVAVIALPGAFTPTCSTAHVPRYEQLAAALLAAGIDDIVCVSVNDAFVLDAWAADQHVSQVRMLADGNGEFTRGMGMLVDKRALGFGDRSWRYSMVVADGVIEKMFIEPDEPGDPFRVSDADTMLAYLEPNAIKPASIAMFTRNGCSFCVRAKHSLAARGLAYSEIPADLPTLLAVSGQRQTPAVFVDGRHIGGAVELDAWLGEQPV